MGAETVLANATGSTVEATASTSKRVKKIF
jgi:hypothetical protein